MGARLGQWPVDPRGASVTAFGPFLQQQLRLSDMGSGLRTEFGTLLGPGARVAAYVRSTGIQSGDDQDIRRWILPTLNQALARCRSGMGDIVYVLPGHVESISSANQMSSLVAGTRIIGLGTSTDRPTFTWTAATATFLLNVANVTIQNCILNLDSGTGGVTIAAPITISAAGCKLIGNQIRMGTDASNNVTIGITTTAPADDLLIAGNYIYSATAAEATTLIQFVGADRLQFVNNVVVGATSSAGVGVIRFLTTASTNILVDQCRIQNNKASSTAAVTGIAGNTGLVDNTLLVVLSGGAAAWGTLASVVIGANVSAHNNPGTGRAAGFGTAVTLS
jgi:hypothetical protein